MSHTYDPTQNLDDLRTVLDALEQAWVEGFLEGPQLGRLTRDLLNRSRDACDQIRSDKNPGFGGRR